MISTENYTSTQFCGACGKKLVYKKNVPQGYSEKTGEKLPEYSQYQCPDYPEDKYIFAPESSVHTLILVIPI